jgi:LysM repeat protein
MRWPLPLLLLCLHVVAPGAQAAPSAAKPRVHVVYSGQRLASIAKRYNVSLEALCNANGMSESDKIRPGQKLLVPPPGDKDGSRTRASSPPPAKASAPEPADTRTPKTEATNGGSLPAERVHRVEPGQRLGSIAKRYGVSVDALCEANGIKRDTTLKPGRLLTVPSLSDRDSKATAAEASPTPRKAASNARAGYLELYTYTARWRGQVVDRKGKLSPAAVTGISRLLGAAGDKPRLDQRLIRLLVQVSDAFGGRPIRIVSGYRTSSYYEDSRHRLSRAVDFSIPGVGNATLRDYLRRFSNVGVGYYPNSSFVHLDVREGAAYWVDYSGPGEAPRTRPSAPRLAREQHEHQHEHEHEHAADGAAEKSAASAGEQPRTRPASVSAESGEAAASDSPPVL